MNIEIITKVIIPILGAILIYIIYPYIKKITTAEQRKEIYDWVKFAVAAAEQMADAGLIKIPKKEFVVEFIQSKGFDISEEDLDTIIEAVVKELNIKQGELKKM